MRDLKPGDRVVVLRCARKELVGRVGVVLGFYSGPVWCDERGLLEHFVGVDLDITPPRCHHNPRYLMRLPDDDEAKRLFRETEKPVTA